MSQDNSLVSQFNKAGFAFQLAVEANLATKKNELQLGDIIREHPWFNPETKDSGFIDLVVQKGAGRFVIECKRSTNAKWVFLEGDARSSGACLAKCHWHCKFGERAVAFEWDNVGVFPPAPQSQFCSIRGASDSKQAMLDRITSELVAATEALSNEELGLTKGTYGMHYIYLPVIVTNAELMVGSFDPREVDMVSGSVEDVEFEKVSAIHYKKSLSVSPQPKNSSRTLLEQNRSGERSVFIVNSASLLDWFREWNMVPKDHFMGFPWDQAKQRFK